ncbi:hypothetical protein GYMLUDRAFT_179263, partial [Collybiopsis luxurians FD-317 M1]
NNTILTATVNFQNISYLNGHSIVYLHMSHYTSAMVSNTCLLDLTLWHWHLRYIDHKTIKSMVKLKLVKGLIITDSTQPDPICEHCLAGKQY